MIYHRHRLLLALLCFPALWTTQAQADRIPSTTKSSTTPSAFHAAIQGFIDGEVAKLKNPATQKAAREALIYEADGHAGGAASAEYQTEYATDISNALATFLRAQNLSLRTRVNAGVVAGEVAAVVNKNDAAAPLDQLAQSLLKDKNEAIALWGVKTAKYVIASVVTTGGNVAPLTKQIVVTVKSHPDFGALVEEAYLGLTLQVLKNGNALPPKAVPAVMPDLLDLLQWRADQYANGTPPSPLAELPLSSFLPLRAWGDIAPNQALRDQTLKGTATFICAVLTAIGNGSNDADVTQVAREFGGAIEVFGINLNSQPLQTAGKAIHEISSSTDPTQLQLRCQNLAAAMQSVGVKIQAPGAAGAGVAAPSPDQSQNPGAEPVAGGASK